VTYYYLLSSLPTLAWGDSCPMGPDYFRLSCLEQLGVADLAELEAVLAGRSGPGGKSAFARDWQRFETHLRDTIARTRARRLGVDVAPFLHEGEEWESTVLEAVEDAFASSNPLEREQALDHCRWARLDELALGHGFDLKAVLIYGLRQQLCERWAGHSLEAGRARLETALQASEVSS
jgi:hypothetical protein